VKASWRILLAAPMLVSCAAAASRSGRCMPPPDGFSEADLVGTWISMVNRDFGSDTLEIRDDGFYRQEIHIKMPEFDYVGEWLPWKLETSDSATPYLHMTGMRLYAFAPQLIQEEVMGGGEGWFVDFCQEPTVMPDGKEVFPGVQMPPGEAVLVVMGDRSILSPAPRGISLTLLPVSDSSSWYYELEAR